MHFKRGYHNSLRKHALSHTAKAVFWPLTQDSLIVSDTVHNKRILNLLTGIHNMLSLFCAALTENKILFYSSSYAQLTNATQAMLALMYPLKFRLVRNEALRRECFTRNNFEIVMVQMAQWRGVQQNLVCCHLRAQNIIDFRETSQTMEETN